MIGSKTTSRFTGAAKLLTLLGILMLLPMMARAQGGAIQGQAILSTGRPAAYALVYACPYVGGGGIPCSPRSLLYSDEALTQSIPNPYTTDQFGNYSFFVAAGSAYIVQINAGGNYYSSLWTVSGTADGTVRSVAVTMPSSIMTCTGSPITSSGTISCALATQIANYVWAGPTSGSAAAPTFRSLVTGDLPFTYSGNTTKLATVSGSILNGDCLQGDASGNIVTTGVICNQTTSVSAADASLIVTPTTGNVTAKINTAHSNMWTAEQTIAVAGLPLGSVNTLTSSAGVGISAGEFFCNNLANGASCALNTGTDTGTNDWGGIGFSKTASGDPTNHVTFGMSGLGILQFCASVAGTFGAGYATSANCPTTYTLNVDGTLGASGNIYSTAGTVYSGGTTSGKATCTQDGTNCPGGGNPVPGVYADSQTGADECAKINSAIATLGGGNGLVYTGSGNSYTCTNSIVKPLNVSLECNNSTIVWTPTSGTPLKIYNTSAQGSPTTKPATNEVSNCIFETPLDGSGVPITSPSTTTNFGAYVGQDPTTIITPAGSWGAFQTIKNSWFYGFNSGLSIGINTWFLALDNDRIAENYYGIYSNATGLSNSGEEMMVTATAIYNNTGPGFYDSSYNLQWNFLYDSFDYNNPNITGPSVYASIVSSHIENSIDCQINLNSSFRDVIGFTDTVFFYNQASTTGNGYLCGANSTSEISAKGVTVQTAGATVNNFVYTNTVAATNICATDPIYQPGATAIQTTDAVAVNCGAKSSGQNVAVNIPGFVAQNTGQPAYGLEATAPTNGSSNLAIFTNGIIQSNNYGGSGSTADHYFNVENFGTGGTYNQTISARSYYANHRIQGANSSGTAIQEWGQGLFGASNWCLEDLTQDLATSPPHCIINAATGLPNNTLQLASGLSTFNSSLTATSSSAETDLRVINTGAQPAYLFLEGGSDGYAATQYIANSQTWGVGMFGANLFSVKNGTTGNNIFTLDASAPANSLTVSSAGIIGGASETITGTIAAATLTDGTCTIHAGVLTGCTGGTGGTLTGSNIAAGSGAGTSPTVSFISGSTDGTFGVTVVTGSSPAGGGTIFTVTFTASRGHVSFCTFSPANDNASQLDAAATPKMTSSPSATSTALVAGGDQLLATSTYVWNMTCP